MLSATLSGCWSLISVAQIVATFTFLSLFINIQFYNLIKHFNLHLQAAPKKCLNLGFFEHLK